MAASRTGKAAPAKSQLAKSPLYRVGRAKTGLGLFAAQDIPVRKLIIEYIGRRITTRRAQEIDRARANKYLFEIDRRWTIDGSTRRNLARYVNHSCDPNTEAESNRGRLMYRAVKPIAAGEEITLDYGEEHMELYFGKAGCLCPSCTDMVKKAGAPKRKTGQDAIKSAAKSAAKSATKNAAKRAAKKRKR